MARGFRRGSPNKVVMKIARAAVAATVLAVIALALPASATRATKARPAKHKVEAQGTFPVFRWEPPEIEIAVGDKVVWTNPTSNEHHVTAYDGPWAEGGSFNYLHIPPGGKGSFRFKEPGTYRYYCDLQFHGQLIGPLCVGQCGTVVVE